MEPIRRPFTQKPPYKTLPYDSEKDYQFQEQDGCPDTTTCSCGNATHLEGFAYLNYKGELSLSVIEDDALEYSLCENCGMITVGLNGDDYATAMKRYPAVARYDLTDPALRQVLRDV